MKKPTAELELRGDRLIMHQSFGHGSGNIEIDVTGVWHFFRDFQEYLPPRD